ncbi:hypothetical protein ECC02_001466 [Trypanosoma cruzi]|uniref:Non-specific serine/threonine protein kinase n=1 Tax=Trypanosoma cruzi TaxID=5693 RepID=A0A7J6YF34_TRYCR|nr:hypothetical protein ECC02_001466 [Trypanosoma cruzi]
MAARLDALARVFFTPSSLCSPRQSRCHDVSCGSNSTAAVDVGARETDGSAAPTSFLWEALTEAHDNMNTNSSSSHRRRPMQSMPYEEEHFFPPLLQYFSELAMGSATMSSATHALLVAPSGMASTTVTPTARTATTGGYTSMRRQTQRRFVEGASSVLRARRSFAHKQCQSDCHTNGAACKAFGHAHSLHGLRASSSLRHSGVHADPLSPDRIDVFANYPQPPLTDGGGSYEALERNYQRGLNALVGLVEHFNRFFMHERGSAATAPTPLGKRAANAETVSATASSAAAGPSDHRDAIVNRLNILLRDLAGHGERALALHVILRTISWRFASKNERVTILFNHLRTCLPTARMSIVTLAMEVWGQLHVIEASSSVYLKITSELISLACDFLLYDNTLAEQLTGLVIIRHVALWPTSLYRALLSNERDSLFLATWTAITNDGSPAFIRELAAEALRALFVIALEQRNYRSVNSVLQHAIALLLVPEMKAELPGSFSLLPSPQYPPGDEGLRDATTVPAGKQPQATSIPALTKHRRGDEKGAGGVTNKKGSGAGASLKLFGQLKRRIVTIGRSLFGISERRRWVSQGLRSSSVNTVVSLRDTAAASVERDSAISVGSCLTFPVFSGTRSGASFVTQRKLQKRLSQVPPPQDRETALHAGTLVVGAFVSAMRSCFPNWEPSVVDFSEGQLTATDLATPPHSTRRTTGVAATTSTTTKTAAVRNTGEIGPSQQRLCGSSSFCVANVCGGRKEAPSGRHASDLPLASEGDHMENMSHSSETDDSAGYARRHQAEEEEEEDDAEDGEDDDYNEDNGVEWLSLRSSASMGHRSLTAPVLLRNRHSLLSSPGNKTVPIHRSLSNSRKGSATTVAAAAPETVMVPAPLAGGDEGIAKGEVLSSPSDDALGQHPVQHNRQYHHHHHSHHKPRRTDSGERHARQLSPQMCVGGRKMAELENFITPHTLRKLLALCYSHATHEAALPLTPPSYPFSSLYTERLLPILALYNPFILSNEDVGMALRLLIGRAVVAFCDPVQGPSCGAGGEELHRGTAFSATYRGNEIRSLALINIGLFLAAIASSHPDIFQATVMRQFYPLLFSALQHDTPKYCPAAFPVLALLVHNIPEVFLERFHPIVKQLTELALSAPFTTEMTGMAAKVCDIYQELRPRCQTALLQRIAEVLTECGARQGSRVDGGSDTKRDGKKAKTKTSSESFDDSTTLLAKSFFNLEEKITCFRVLQGFCMEWEGTAFFFLEVCMPYMSHRHAPLRRECVLSCVNLLLSDCFHAIPQETGKRSFLGGRIHRATCRPRRLFLTGINNSTEHATIHSAKAMMNTRGVGPEPDYRSALTGSLHRRQNSSPVAVAAATRRRRMSDTTTKMASHSERNSNPVFSPEPDVAVTCDRHTGRSHINTLREVLHRLVEVAVCDPEESIRHVALKNLTVETDQFLCTDAAILDLLFAAFNDAYLPNRLEVVRILRRIAQCTYSVVYPRLRKLFLQMLRHFQDRIFLSYSQHEGKVNTTVNITAEELQLLFELVQAVPHSISLHLDSILRLLREILLPHHTAERGTVIIALHMLSYFMDESTREEWTKFELLLELLAGQLLLRDGDAERLHAAIGTLQKVVQYFVVTKPFYNTSHLQTIIGSLHSLLHQKPSIGSELSLSVLKLLGTISSIEPYYNQREDGHDTAMLLGRPEYKRRLPSLFHTNVEAVILDNRSCDKPRTRFTESMWPDIILRVLLRTFFEALNGVLTFTNEELGACLQATVAILREIGTLRSLEHYMPSLLSALAGLFSRDGADSPLRVSTMENLAELVQVAGRTIAPMYALLVAFLEQHWVFSWYALPSCCKLLMALCKAVPDLAQEHCERFLSLLLGELMRLLGEISSASRSSKQQQRHCNVCSIKHATAVEMNTATSVIREVLKAIHSLLPIADQSAVQSACLALAQLLRNPAITSAPLDLAGYNGALHVSTSSLSFSAAATSVFDADVSHDIAQVLVDFLNDCDMTTKATAVVESVLLQLWHYAQAHKAMLQVLAEKQQEQQKLNYAQQQKQQKQRRYDPDCHWRRQFSWSRRQVSDVQLASVMNRSSLEQELRRRRGDQKVWFNCSSLARVVIMQETTGDDPEVNYTRSFPFRETTTSWESPVEMDLLACVLVVAGRCRLPAVSYDLMIGEYLKERFDPDSPVVNFFRNVTSPHYRLCLLPLGAQKPQASLQPPQPPPPQPPPSSYSKEEEGRGGSAHHLLGHVNLDAVALESAVSLGIHADGLRDDISPLGRREAPPHSTPIPVRARKQPLRSSRSASFSSHPIVSSSLATLTTSGVNSVTQILLAREVTPESGRGSMRGTNSSLLGCGTYSVSRPASNFPPAVSVGSGSFVRQRVLKRQPDVLSSGNNSIVNFAIEGVVSPGEERPLPSMEREDNNKGQDAAAADMNDHDDDNDDGGYETEEQRFFLQHENLSASEWRPWFELFCTMLVESSDHVCVSICSTLVRRHFTIFSSDLLPIAFLSHLTKCDDRVVRRWMRLICDFVHMHDYLPQIIAAELARLAHHIRLYSSSLFSRPLARAIEQNYITLDLLVVLAERALNPPLLLLYTQQQILAGFSWEALARLLMALGDVKYDNDPRCFSRDPRIRHAAYQLLHATRSKYRKGITSTDEKTGVGKCNHSTEKLPWEMRQNLDSDKGDVLSACVALEPVAEGDEEECMPSPLFLELGWFEAASRQYLRSIWTTIRILSGGERGTTSASSTRPILSPNDVVGAMRCYMRVYDFESIINMWMRIKGFPLAPEEEWASALTVEEEQQQQSLQRALLGTAWAPSTGGPVIPHIKRYVVSAAQALSRWEFVEDIDYNHLFADKRDERDRYAPSFGDFSFYKQMEIFRAAALTASKEYEEAKGVLSALRSALRESYAVFHTENARMKFELNIMFQQISDLEEGIDAIELKTGLGDGAGKVVGTAASMANLAGSATAVGDVVGGDSSGGAAENRRENSIATGANGVRESVEPQQSRWRGRVAYSEATVRRLKNIAGRPLPAHSTVLQRFEIIALRSTLVSPDWQLRNILELSERIVREGMPKRAVRTINHFYSLPIDNNDTREERKYRDTLLLEKYRIELQHLFCTRDLECLHNEITDGLMLRCSRGLMHAHGFMRGTEFEEMPVDAFFGSGPVSEEQAELLLLHIECQRKLKAVYERRRHISLEPAPFFVPNPHMGAGSLGDLEMILRARFHTSSSHDANMPDGEEDEYNPADVLLREYRIMEHIIGSSVTLASVWREFGLLLFDVCMAIYAEWNNTKEPETLKNFCVQSQKAISALQKSVQFWSSAASTSVSGIGPFTTASTRRSRHARSAIPAVHLLLKALHLALKLEEVGMDSTYVGDKNKNVRNTFGDDAGRAASVAAAPDRSETWERGAGFAHLDFSPAMYLHWGYILPFLVNAAARHSKLHDAVRDMCAHSRAMLYQCVFHLVSTFEHRYSSILALEAAKRDQTLHYEENYPCGSSSSPLIAPHAKTAPASTAYGAEETAVDDAMRRRTPCHARMTSTESTYTVHQQQPQLQGTVVEWMPAVGNSERREEGRRAQSPSDTHDHPQRQQQQQSRYHRDIHSSHQQQQQWHSAMLLKLAENGPEHKAIISQTMQLCEFVRSGKGNSLSLGACALPVPTWFLQHRMVEVDTNELELQKGQPKSVRSFLNTTDKHVQTERDIGSKSHDNANATTTTINNTTTPFPTTAQESGSKALQRVLHVRRKLCSLPSERRREEIFLFFISDGSVLRFHSIGMEEDSAASAISMPCSLTEPHETHSRLAEAAPATCTATHAVPSSRFKVHGGSDMASGGAQPNPFPATTGGNRTPLMDLVENSAFIRPLAAMETAVCCLLGHIPIRHARRPLVLPVGIQEFITQLPDRAAYSSSWQLTLPPSLQFNCTASMLRQPSSLFHIISKYKANFQNRNPIQAEESHEPHHQQEHQEQQQQQQQQHKQEGVFQSGKIHNNDTPSQPPQEEKVKERIGARRASRSHRNRRELLTRYESLLEIAFDHGKTGPLCSFLHRVLSSNKLSEAEYPRPASQMVKLLEEITEAVQQHLREVEEVPKGSVPAEREAAPLFSLETGNEENRLGERRGSSFMSSSTKGWKTMQLQAKPLTKVRMAIFRAEAPRYAPLLRLAFQAASADAAEWLDAVHLFTHELAEWSMLQYLFDATHRESTTFFVDVTSGHVASHHIGVHALQPLPRALVSRHHPSFSTGGCSRVDEQVEEATPNKSPFPCTDPTIFRLTGCLISPLPLRCPYSVFLGAATQFLYSTLRYSRDLAGIAKFGLQDMKCFAWRGALFLQPPPGDGMDMDITTESGSVTILPEVPNREIGRLVTTAFVFQPPDISTNLSVVAMSLGEFPGTPPVEGAAQTMGLNAMVERLSLISSPTKVSETTVTIPGGGVVQEPLMQPAKSEANCELERKRTSAVATTATDIGATVAVTKRKATAATTISAMEAARKMSFSTINTAALYTWGARRTTLHHLSFTPRIFDVSSIILKLMDDRIPMLDEPIVTVFDDPQFTRSEELIQLYPSENSTIKFHETPTKEADDTMADQYHCDVVENIEERVKQLICSAVSQENLLGTPETPHRWSSWAPQW